ncbi:MAG TPA: hypothetical protein VME63_17420 [Dyella sp.]|uniref:hypothetical protein n=1 Tax=Dyella sp. TaxID=1869338 RepID=UPI002C89C403|nr:hypothetical protein [Dyella sp.]HTV87182.1 hypothetical protein [Dyella sp.]
MGNVLLRRDFVPFDTYCAIQGKDQKRHRLRSCRAFVIDMNGNQEFVGPGCASALLGHTEFLAAKRLAPDLTTHDLTTDEQSGHAGDGVEAGAGGAVDEASRRHSYAAGYLHLRATALGLLPGIRSGVAAFGPLVELHAQFNVANRLTTDEVNRVLHIEEAARAKAWIYSRMHLMDVYSAHHQMLRRKSEAVRDIQRHADRANSLERWAKTLQSIHAQLLQTLFISEKQIKACKLNLRPEAFDAEKCNPRFTAKAPDPIPR